MVKGTPVHIGWHENRHNSNIFLSSILGLFCGKIIRMVSSRAYLWDRLSRFSFDPPWYHLETTLDKPLSCAVWYKDSEHVYRSKNLWKFNATIRKNGDANDIMFQLNGWVDGQRTIGWKARGWAEAGERLIGSTNQAITVNRFFN